MNRRKSRRLACSFAVMLFILLGCQFISFAAADETADMLSGAGLRTRYPSFFHVDSLKMIIQKGIELTFTDRFAKAESLYAAVSDAYPSSPIGPLFAAATVHAQMLDSESPQRRGDFLRWLNMSKERAERWRAAEPRNGEPEFVLGAALGYQAVYESRWGGWFAALKQGLRSKNRFAAALKKDLSLADAFLGIGNFNYWKSVKTDFDLIYFFHHNMLSVLYYIRGTNDNRLQLQQERPKLIR